MKKKMVHGYMMMVNQIMVSYINRSTKSGIEIAPLETRSNVQMSEDLEKVRSNSKQRILQLLDEGKDTESIIRILSEDKKLFELAEFLSTANIQALFVGTKTIVNVVLETYDEYHGRVNGGYDSEGWYQGERE